MGIASTRANKSSADSGFVGRNGRVTVLADQKDLNAPAVRGEPGPDLSSAASVRTIDRSDMPWRKIHRSAVAFRQRRSRRATTTNTRFFQWNSSSGEALLPSVIVITPIGSASRDVQVAFLCLLLLAPAPCVRAEIVTSPDPE
jgi:hypothetical protein